MRRLGIIAIPLLLCAAGMRPEEAQLREQAVRHPQSFAANRSLAEYYIHHGQIRAALAWLEKAERIKPGDYRNSYDLALARLETRDLDGARKLVRDMLSRQDRGELHNLLGDVEEAAGNTDAAAREYERAARMDPSEKNLFDLGTDLLRHRAYSPALTTFQYATGKYPKSAGLRVGLGIALYSLGKYDDAVETLCRAVDLDPKDTRALDFLGGMYDVSPELAGEVTRRLAHFADLYPDNASADYYYALSLRKRNLTGGLNGTESKVEALLKNALALRPDFADAHYQLALLYSDQHRMKEAVGELEETIRLRPDMKPAHYRLAQLYEAQGKAQLAHKEFEAFRQLQDRNGAHLASR
jgi:Tfp pilus assembly protein PilF